MAAGRRLDLNDAGRIGLNLLQYNPREKEIGTVSSAKLLAMACEPRGSVELMSRGWRRSSTWCCARTGPLYVAELPSSAESLIETNKR